MADKDDNKLVDNDDWSNLLLKIELDLRSQFFFISYLQSVRSTINPYHDGELTKIPTIVDILKTLAKDLASTKPLNIPAKYTVDAYHYVLEDLNRLKMTKKRMAKYDYLKEEIFRSTYELPPSISFEDQLQNLGGYEIYSMLVGDQSIRATWHGQLRLRPDTIEQSLDVLMFRYKPNPPHSLFKLSKHKCQKLCDFLERDVPRYEASRLLRISIPIDHIGGIHFLPYPGGSSSTHGQTEARSDLNRYEKKERKKEEGKRRSGSKGKKKGEENIEIYKSHSSRYRFDKYALDSPAILGIDIMHPVNFYTRRVNCTHNELNEWKERDDFTINKLGSTYTRYLLCGPVEHLFKTVGILIRFRPYLRNKLAKGIPDITTVCVQQFGPTHEVPVEPSTSEESEESAVSKRRRARRGHRDKQISPEVLDVLVNNNILDPNSIQKDYPLDGYDVCFQDFLSRIHDPTAVDQALKAPLPEIDPSCKLSEYMMDHRGLSGTHYSFCKGKVVGDDVYHCKKCKECSGLDHWHSHSHKKPSKEPCAPTEKKFMYPIPLSGKLLATQSDRQSINETGNASGVDDMDEPNWPNPKQSDAVENDWLELNN